MRILVSIIVLVLILLAVFTAVNWSILTTPTPMSFVFFDIDGPLGGTLLAIMLALVLLVVAYAMLLRTTWLVESRRLNRQLQEQRELAQQAETSRFVTLQQTIEKHFAELNAAFANNEKTTIAHVDSVSSAVQDGLNESLNSLIAHIGYVDDKLNQALPAGSESPKKDDNSHD